MVTLENLIPDPATNQYLLEKEIKKEFSDSFKEFQENEDSSKELVDYYHEIIDSVFPIYNADIINQCYVLDWNETYFKHSELSGGESQNPLEILSDNLYVIYYCLGNEVLEDFLNQEGKNENK
tara:strand:- start:86 stop:454 length:369 start_codon:yes stop_codon:yes gene_type:complete